MRLISNSHVSHRSLVKIYTITWEISLVGEWGCFHRSATLSAGSVSCWLRLVGSWPASSSLTLQDIGGIKSLGICKSVYDATRNKCYWQCEVKYGENGSMTSGPRYFHDSTYVQMTPDGERLKRVQREIGPLARTTTCQSNLTMVTRPQSL